MKILYIHQYFKTPKDGGSIRSYHLAKGLVDHGHQVTMITSHSSSRQVMEVDGIKTHYLNVGYANHFGFIRRIYAFLKFVYLAKKEFRKLPKHDLAYVMTTPLTTGLIALDIKNTWNIPFHFEVGDLWPEAPIKMGAIQNRLLKRLLYRFEKKCYFEAQRVIALSPAIRNYIEASCPETKVHVLPNIADNTFFEPHLKLQTFSEKNPFKIGYFGAFGVANHLEYLVDVAEAAQRMKLPVAFLLMGEGASLKRMQARSRNLNNFKIVPYGSTHEVKDLLEQQDAVYISFKNIEILNTGSPNKFFDGLAAGKLIIVNFGGWIRNVIEYSRCGFYHDPEHPEEFARKLQVFLKEPDLVQKYQKQARKLAETYYDKNLQIQKLLKILSNEKRLDISGSEFYILTA